MTSVYSMHRGQLMRVALWSDVAAAAAPFVAPGDQTIRRTGLATT